MYNLQINEFVTKRWIQNIVKKIVNVKKKFEDHCTTPTPVSLLGM